jgi:hypothetical protein
MPVELGSETAIPLVNSAVKKDDLVAIVFGQPYAVCSAHLNGVVHTPG